MYEFDNNEEKQAETSQPAMSSLNEASKDILSIVVRLCGLILMFIGLWIAIQVFNEAIALYKDPTNIERMATAIESGSNIDKSLVPLKASLLSDEQAPEAKPTTENTNGIRLSYFIAWIIDLLLLLLLARIALMAIKTGGELALYDAQIKRFAKQIVKESNKK